MIILVPRTYVASLYAELPMFDPPTHNFPFADKREKVGMDGVPNSNLIWSWWDTYENEANWNTWEYMIVSLITEKMSTVTSISTNPLIRK